MKPTFGSLFSGITGLDLGLERAGWSCRWQVEIEPFCIKVLEKRWPDVRRFNDVRSVRGEPAGRGAPLGDGPAEPGRGPAEDLLAPIDLLCGGFPCQDLSVAGKRKGLGGERSSLFFEFARLASELQPRWLLIENVPGLYSSHRGRDFGVLLHRLDECGYDAEWVTLDSRFFGVPQRRRRVFIVGHLRAAGDCPFPLLAESEGGQGHPAASRETGERPAFALAASVRGTGDGHGNAWNSNYVTVPETAATLNPGHEAKHSYAGDGGTLNLVVGPLRTNPYNNSDPTMEIQQLVIHPLSAEGTDASEDGTGRGTPIICFGGDRDGQDAGEVSPPLRHRGDEPHHHRAFDKPSIALGSSVRRLTPLECERLQGFPDGWTCLCGCDPYSTAACKCPDSPRYRALGNAVTVSVAEWIGRQLLRALEEAR